MSYPHSPSSVVKEFVQNLCIALRDYLGPYVKNAEPYADRPIQDEDQQVTAGLNPGAKFNEALAEYICQSACMIVVYMPIYEQSTYCRREYAAMEKVERERVQKLAENADPKLGMIIPIVLRKRPGGNVPGQIGKFSGERHYADFTKFNLASIDLGKHQDYIPVIDQIAQHIAQVYEMLQPFENEISGGCDRFTLPKPDEAPPWSEPSTTKQTFVFRSNGQT